MWPDTSDENNANPRFPIVSKGASSVFGVPPEAIVEDAIALIDKIHPDDLPSFEASVKRSWEALEQWDWKGRFEVPGSLSQSSSSLGESSFSKRVRGGYKWMRCSSQPRRLPNGHTIWYGACFDIQARAGAESNPRLRSSP